jgi:hypothetical protein
MLHPQYLRALPALVLVAVVGCGNTEREIDCPSASTAVEHYYDAGCVMTYDGHEQDEEEALNVIEYIWNTHPGCRDVLETWLCCIGRIGTGECRICDDSAEGLSTCAE